MKHFVVLLPMLDMEKSQVYRQEHLDYLEQKRSEGTIFAYGRFNDGSGGMVIYKGETREEINAIALNDPFVIHGARTYKVHEWNAVFGER